jgi:uncharacterized protein (DUF305 family)
MATLKSPMSSATSPALVKEIIPLHQGEVDMAKTVLAFGKDPEIKKAAEEAIKIQEAEIAWMKEWLKKQAQ